MLNNIIVGKHALESLTTGMYHDAKVIFREYLQNSVDSIKKAINKNIINENQGQIYIKLNKKQQRIEITDNGYGLSSKNSVKTLLDIGNSNKNPKNNIGFRGIGRLSGLGYSKHIKFITSSKGENKKTTVIFDASKLRKIMRKSNNAEILEVIQGITEYEINKEKESKHYFKVILNKVKNIDHILEYSWVKRYLTQIAPIPFKEDEFSFVNKIKGKFKKKGLSINEYEIFLSNSDKTEKLYKNYNDIFYSNRTRSKHDKIKDVKIEFIKNKRDNIIAALWYSQTNFYGTLKDRKKKGLRLRKDNIQIGDRSILNKIFKESRFNGWFQGEVHVYDKQIIPNARRDNFEKNDIYKLLLEKLSDIGNHLSNNIRLISNKRSQEKKLDKIYEKIDIINGIKNNNINNKLINLMDKIPKREKKILDKIFKIIETEFENEEYNKFIKVIIDKY